MFLLVSDACPKQFSQRIQEEKDRENSPRNFPKTILKKTQHQPCGHRMREDHIFLEKKKLELDPIRVKRVGAYA